MSKTGTWQDVLRRRLPLYCLTFSIPLAVSLFFIGFRFDDYWSAFVNGFLVLFWPVLVPFMIREELNKRAVRPGNLAGKRISHD
ncbi:MAG: hypothetical protein AAFO93_12740 [Pseudomonadota bacterium]